MEVEGVAIPLIVYYEREGFKVTPEGLALLNSIDKKIGVISVAGKYRTGKSYLLNKIILNIKGQGFGVGPSINPCTKGIWIYNRPIDITTADGEEIALLIIDSEGLGAFDEDSNHDTKIFMFSVLLSSFFIYNSVGSIDENALNNISLIVSLTKNLQIRSSDSELDVDEVANYFPSFLWVLRDFSLQLIDTAGKVITSKEYLENSLMPQKGVSDLTETKNRIRKLLKHFFKDRDCFVLVRPSDNEETLQNLQNVAERELRPEFIRQAALLRKNIYRKVKVKSFNGKPLNGKMLATIALSYVDAINKGAVPTIEGAWQSVVSSECNKQIDLVTAEYEKNLKQLMTSEPLSPQEMKKVHRAFKQEAKAKFKDKAVGDDIEPYMQMLKKRIIERFEVAKTQNDRKLMEKCQEKCKEVTTEFEDKLKSGEFTDFQTFKREFERRMSGMRKEMPIGEATELKLKEMSANLLTEAADYISRNALMEQRNSNRRLAEQLEMAKSTIDSKKEEFSRERDYYKQRMQELESENFKYKASTTSLELRLEEIRLEKERLSSSHQKHVETIKDDLKDRYGEYKEKYEQTLALYQDLQKKYSEDVNKAQKDLALARQEADWKNKELLELKSRRESFEGAFNDVRIELRRTREDLEGKEELIKTLRSEVRTSEPTEWINERLALRNQIESLKAQIEEHKSVKEALVTALQTRAYDPAPEIKDNTKHLTLTLERTEERCQELEQRLERLKKFQKIFLSSTSIQCKICGKSFSSKLFFAHISVCEEALLRNSEVGEYNIVATQVQSREEGIDQRGGGIEYYFSVTYKGRTWTLQKVFKNFRALESTLKNELQNLEIPDAADINPREAGSIFNNKNNPTAEERKRRLQDYLMKLAGNNAIKKSAAFRKFLNTDQYFPEESYDKKSSEKYRMRSNEDD